MRKLRTSELNRLTNEEFKQAEKLPIRVILDDVRSHHNVGSIFRTCDAFRISKLILAGITPTPPHLEIEKTALGATESVEWEYVDDLSKYLKHESGLSAVIGMEHTTKSVRLNEFSISNYPLTIVFGNEVKGISSDVLALCDTVVEIPQIGTKHSFNVSVSAGIALWEFSRQLL